jgi:23S rRNA pseudouridine2605 synthase
MEPDPPAEIAIRLDRLLAGVGGGSRREAARRVRAGRVAVGGAVVLNPGLRVDPATARVDLDGAPLAPGLPGRLVVALHKPPGVITSRVDSRGRPTVYDLLPRFDRWVFPVGRLDRDTTGLLILTDDPALGQRLTDPSHRVPKTYHARVRGLPGPEAIRVLGEGVPIAEDRLTRPANVRLLGGTRGGDAWVEIVLTEGRKRQVRRMCAAVGHPVVELVRVRVGGLWLGDLAPGEWRALGPDDLHRLIAGTAGARLAFGVRS